MTIYRPAPPELMTELAESRRYSVYSGKRGRPLGLFQEAYPGVDLAGEVLADGMLHEVDLSGACLDGARLSGIWAGGVLLRGASMVGLVARKAMLEGADLTEVTATGARLYKPQLRGALLDRARLDGASLLGAQAQKASLREADLRGADLRQVSLDETDLTDARLDGACLDGAHVTSRTRLRGVTGLASTRVAHVWVDGVRVEGADVHAALARVAGYEAAVISPRPHPAAPPASFLAVPAELAAILADAGPRWPRRREPGAGTVHLSHRSLPGVDLADAVLADGWLVAADLGAARLDRADAKGSLASGVVLVGASMVFADFTGATLVDADLKSITAKEARFARADLHWARFDNARLDETDFTGARCRGARFTGADLRAADLTGADLRDADLSGAQLDGARLDGCQMSTLTRLAGAFGLVGGIRAEAIVLDGEELRGDDLAAALQDLAISSPDTPPPAAAPG